MREFHDPIQRRARKACLSCRKKKIRCVWDDDAGYEIPCRRCMRDGIKCEVPQASRRGGIRNVMVGRERHRRVEQARKAMASNATVSALSKELYCVNDALNILTHVAEDCDNQPSPDEGSESAWSDREDNIQDTGGSVKSDGSSGLPSRSPDLGYNSGDSITFADSILVKRGLLTAEEAGVLVQFFSENMQPCCLPFPQSQLVPAQLARQPVLLSTIGVLASRYFIENPDKYTMTKHRARELHKPVWDFCYNELSHQWWSVPDEQMRSSIYAMLLLTEWIPVSLDGASDGHYDGYTTAIRSYSRLCWLLSGQAMRIAQDSGLIETDSMLFIFLHATDYVLSCRLGREPMLNINAPNGLPGQIEQQCSLQGRARLDLLKIMYLANRTLYSSREATRQLVESGRFITILNLLWPHFQLWRLKYKEIVEDKSWESQSVLYEFNHSTLYVFSLALISKANQAETMDNMIYLQDTTKYLNAATSAARACIEFVSDPNSPTPIKAAPVRWMVRLMHSAVFLTKCLLFPALSAPRDSPAVLISAIRTSTDTLIAAESDSVPLTRGYARMLRELCDKFEQVTDIVPHMNGSSSAPRQARSQQVGPLNVNTSESTVCSESKQQQENSGVSQAATHSELHTSCDSKLESQTSKMANNWLPPHRDVTLQDTALPDAISSFSGTQNEDLNDSLNTLSQDQNSRRLSLRSLNIEPSQSVYPNFGMSVDNSLEYMPSAMEDMHPISGSQELSQYLDLTMSIPGGGIGFIDKPEFGSRLLSLDP